LLLGAVGYSLALSQLTIALLAGNAMAGERADRSAEFMAYLPVSRPKRMAAKLILAGCAAAVIWGFSSVMASLILGASEQLRTAWWTRPWDRLAIDAAVFFATYVAITGATFFGVAWLVSSFQSSPTFAACAGLITPVLVVAGLQAVALLCKPRLTGPIVGGGYAIICLSLACCGLAAGSLYYIRRVEP
jgi:ABC-type transport system involved in multi-copper enzyme maturation permease subunit